MKKIEKFIERDACKKGISFCVDFCSGCFKSALRNQNDYSIMNEEFNRTNSEQLFGAELRSEADDFIRLNTNTTGEIHENIFSPP